MYFDFSESLVTQHVPESGPSGRSLEVGEWGVAHSQNQFGCTLRNGTKDRVSSASHDSDLLTRHILKHSALTYVHRYPLTSRQAGLKPIMPSDRRFAIYRSWVLL